jgi:hypothetical protein
MYRIYKKKRRRKDIQKRMRMRLTRINDAVYIRWDALLLLCVCVDVPYSAGLYAVQ